MLKTEQGISGISKLMKDIRLYHCDSCKKLIVVFMNFFEYNGYNEKKSEPFSPKNVQLYFI